MCGRWSERRFPADTRSSQNDFQPTKVEGAEMNEMVPHAGCIELGLMLPRGTVEWDGRESETASVDRSNGTYRSNGTSDFSRSPGRSRSRERKGLDHGLLGRHEARRAGSVGEVVWVV